jgi:hypothetical protein
VEESYARRRRGRYGRARRAAFFRHRIAAPGASGEPEVELDPPSRSRWDCPPLVALPRQDAPHLVAPPPESAARRAEAGPGVAADEATTSEDGRGGGDPRPPAAEDVPGCNNVGVVPSAALRPEGGRIPDGGAVRGVPACRRDCRSTTST